MSTLLVIRHGETDWNAERRAQGHLDITLNLVGVDQAMDVASRLAAELGGLEEAPPVYTSDLARARETAEIVAAALGAHLSEVPELRERMLGIVQGKTWTELRETHPEQVRRYKSGEDRDAIPGIEPIAEFRARCLAAANAIAFTAELAVVVTHGGVLRVLLQEVHGDQQFMIGNTALYRFRVSDGLIERVLA